jgi:DNA polymerase III alpha subunit
MILQPPKNFISIHSHSHFSTYDGLGQPSDHIDFCLNNGLSGWSLTDHGNGNGLAHAHAHAKKVIKSKGAKFRQLYGVEFYFVPDLADWKVRYDLSKQDSSKAVDNEEEAGLVVEDADETRSDADRFVDVNKRYHLVVIAKNRIGLSNLFTLVKKSYVDGFYKFPRIDFKLLKQHGEGLVVSTACVTGDAELVTDRGAESLLSVIERYKMGEHPIVLSFNETSKELQFKRVLWGDKTRTSAKLVKLKTADGKEIRLTPDHQVLTDKGWLRADELKKNMPIKIVSL